MKASLKELQVGISKRSLIFEGICPYPFNPSISTIPFPKHFEILKFDKYKGRGDPRDHLQEFYVHCQEVLYNDNYLLRDKQCDGEKFASYL